jgi:hypothetical protein
MPIVVFSPHGENEWISNKQNNGDFDYWLRLKLHDFGQEREAGTSRYCVDIAAIAPELLSEDQLRSVSDCTGVPFEELLSSPIESQVSDIGDYGLCAYLYSSNGENKNRLVREAKQEAQTIPILFGFYMDKRQNQIGKTGWDFIKGHN